MQNRIKLLFDFFDKYFYKILSVLSTLLFLTVISLVIYAFLLLHQPYFNFIDLVDVFYKLIIPLIVLFLTESVRRSYFQISQTDKIKLKKLIKLNSYLQELFLTVDSKTHSSSEYWFNEDEESNSFFKEINGKTTEEIDKKYARAFKYYSKAKIFLPESFQLLVEEFFTNARMLLLHFRRLKYKRSIDYSKDNAEFENFKLSFSQSSKKIELTIKDILKIPK